MLHNYVNKLNDVGKLSKCKQEGDGNLSWPARVKITLCLFCGSSVYFIKFEFKICFHMEDYVGRRCYVLVSTFYFDKNFGFYEKQPDFLQAVSLH